MPTAPNRRRVRSWPAVTALALVLATVPACSHGSPSPPAVLTTAPPRTVPRPTRPTRSTAPPPSPAVAGVGHRWLCVARTPRTAADLRVVLNHHDPRWQGGDGAVDVALPDGRVLWIFGDTTFGQVTSRGALVAGHWGIAHGSLLVEAGRCVYPFYRAGTAAPANLVPSPGRHDAYWPGAGWVSPDHRSLLLMLSHVRLTAAAHSAFGFTLAGNAIARFSLPDLRLRSIEPLRPPPISHVHAWLGQPLLVGRWLYLYSVADRTQYVARAPAATRNWSSVHGWQYWDGRAWSADRRSLQAMVVSHPPLAGLAVSRFGSRFLAIAKTQEAFSSDVAGWIAPSPEGPWTSLGTVATTDPERPSLSYAAHAVTDIPGANPVLIWSISPSASRTIRGAGIAVVPLPDRLRRVR